MWLALFLGLLYIKNLDHFSIYACHPCAGAMLIFSVSFQFYWMSSKMVRGPKNSRGMGVSGISRKIFKWRLVSSPTHQNELP